MVRSRDSGHLGQGGGGGLGVVVKGWWQSRGGRV